LGKTHGHVPVSFCCSRSITRACRDKGKNTILKALKGLGHKGRMTGHGFRALAMSAIKENLGYRHEVVDRHLAHAPANKVDAAYDRAVFLDERRKMMQDSADYLDKLQAPDVQLRIVAQAA
jgi:integrase